MRIDFLAKAYQPFSFNFYTSHRLGHSLNKYGIETNYEILFEGDLTNYLLKNLESPADWTISFEDLNADNLCEPFCEKIKRPHFFWASRPFFHLNYLKSFYGYLGCPDRSYSQFIKEAGMGKICFLPLGYDNNLLKAGNSDKDYEVVFFEKLVDPEVIYNLWLQRLSRRQFEVMELALEYVNIQKCLPVQALLVALKQKDMLAEFNYATLLYEFEEYLRSKQLIELIESIKDVRIDVFGQHSGKDWLLRLKNADHVYLHADVAYTEKLSILKRCKIFISQSFFTPQGCEDLIFQAIALGAYVIAKSSSYLQTIFSNQTVMLFEDNEIKQVNEKVHLYIHNEKKRNLLVSQAQDKIQTLNWDKQAEKWIKALEDF